MNRRAVIRAIEQDGWEHLAAWGRAPAVKPPAQPGRVERPFPSRPLGGKRVRAAVTPRDRSLPDVPTLADRIAQFLPGSAAGLAQVVALSVAVSLAATGAASLIGLPLGAVLAMARFPGRRALVVLANALLGLPPVVVGLALYLLLSRAGPLGGLGLLFTPAAMVLAQFLLALPIVTALSHRACAGLWASYGDDLRVNGASPARAVLTLLAVGRAEMMTAVLAGFGRTVSEVGAILIVGGNIAGHTRTMTTSVVLETSRGNLGTALALGAILVGISLAVSAGAFALTGRRAAPRAPPGAPG